MASFAVKFLGCKVSQADAMIARRALLAAGHVEAPEDEAELHVINTCCITSEAEAKSRQSVRRSLRSAGEVLVSGCAANLDAAQFRAIDERVRTFVGSAEDVAEQMAAGLGGCADLDHDVLARRAALAREPLVRRARTRGFIKIQDGCDCHCAYCIIPTVRGEARSRPASAVLDEARRRVDEGQPEMVMTGISVGDYRDPERGLELGELMVEVAQVPGVERVRLSSVEVIHVKDSLLEALATEPKVCPHLHVPMQSGDDDVLRAMGRHYDAGEYLEIDRGAARGRAARQPHDRRDRRLPDRDRRGVRADARRCRRRRHHEGPHVLVLAAARHASPRRSAIACRPRRRSAARASSAGARRSARATIARPSSAAASGC